MTAREFTPDYATPPGETLAEWLDEHALGQAELASRAGMDPDTLGRIVAGAAPVDEGTALTLARVTGIPARMWTVMEAHYRADLARLTTTPPAG